MQIQLEKVIKINITKETLPLYILTKLIDNPSKIGITCSSFEKTKIFCDKLVGILKQITEDYKELRDIGCTLIKLYNGSEIYLFTSDVHTTRGKRLGEYIFIDKQEIPKDEIDTVIAGVVCNLNDTISTISTSDILIVSRNHAK